MAAQNPTRILVVDDSTVIRQAIKKMLQTDFDVVIAADGEAGWEQLVADDLIKCLITDIEMPRLDGYAFICRARAAEEPRIRDLPIIAITGAEDEQTKVRAYACGATDFITKPLDRVQLQARVHAYMRYDQTARDLTEKSVVLEEEAISDPVTHLRSRRYFLSHGEQDLAFALRHQQDLSVIRLDLDNFKKLYQQYGDDAVDRILIHVAKILSGAARAEDTVARVGGAEFALLAPSTTRAQAAALCERLRAAIESQPVQFNGMGIALTASMGVTAIAVDKRESVAELLKLAEQRLGHAKAEGGNRVSVGVLGEAVEPEELTLAAPADGPLPESQAAPLELEATAFGQFGGQPDAAAEMQIDFDVPGLMPEFMGELRPPDDAVPPALVSIDKALQLIARGEGERLGRYLPELVREVLPLLEFYKLELPADAQECVERLVATLRRDR